MMTVESVHHVNVPLRAGKKMKKRKELDALVANSAGKRCGNVSGGSGSKRSGSCSQDGLLSESTDEQDDYWSSGKDARVVNGTRSRLVIRRRACGSLLRACTAILVFACVVATTTVMWLFIDIREQVTSLRTELDQVVAGSQGVPIALQQCHSLSKDLQQNQTALFNRLAALTVQFGNFSSQLTAVQYGLFAMEERLKASPELINVPQTLKDLSASVASFGSEVRDLNSTVTALKDQNNHLQDTSSQLVLNITSVKQSVMQLLNSSQPSQVPSKESAAEKEFVLDKIRQLSANVTHVNATLSSKLQWALDEQPNNRKLIDALRESDQNLSTRLTTMEGQFASQVPVLAIISNLTQQANSSQVQLSDVVSHVQRLQVDYEQLERNATQLASAMNDVRQVVTSLVPPQTNSAPNEETYDPETKPSSTLISTPSGT